MRYWYDTEFIEDGKTIDLISIGVTAEDGREYYAISTEFNRKKASQWVKDNVLVYLPPKSPNPADPCVSPRMREEARAWKKREQIRNDVMYFCDPEKYGKPEFWGYYSAYDHVVLCQLFGTMMNLPDGWPYYTRDLRQWADSMGITQPLDHLVPQENEHHALADAKWTRKAWLYLKDHEAALQDAA